MTQRNAKKEILKGIGILFLYHLGLAVVSWLLSFLWFFLYSVVPFLPLQKVLVHLGAITRVAMFGIGLVQLFYAIPLGLKFKRQRRFNAMKGVIIGAVITVLLNGGCFVLLVWLISSMHG